MGILRILIVVVLAAVLILVNAPWINEPVPLAPVAPVPPSPAAPQTPAPTLSPTPSNAVPSITPGPWAARVDRIEPAQGPLNGGTLTVITGSGLDQVTDVIFGADVTARIRDRSAASLSVQVPPGPGIGPVDVTLVGPDGARLAAGSYRYVRAVPRVVSLRPRTGREGTVVTIEGRFPGEIESVTFGLRPAKILVRGRARLVVRAPSQQQPGPVQVTVFGSGGTDVADEAFTYLGDESPTGPSSSPTAKPGAPQPQPPDGDDRVEVTSATPDSGPMSGGTSVTITGRNLNLVTGVRFGDLQAAIASRSDTTLVVIAPAVTGEFSVTIVLDHRKGGLEAGRFRYVR
ncbi:MAG: IPT/TIG domain-containing protein [Actinomycetales bacterium]|nr:IPT/TIG domain-containing protein [Actinomycetales bacterium]